MVAFPCAGRSSWLQIAVSFALVVAAGLFLHTFASLNQLPLGFVPEPLLVAELNLQPGGGPPQERGARVERLRDATAAVPGVRSAAVSSVRLLTGGGTSTGMVAIGDGPMSRDPAHALGERHDTRLVRDDGHPAAERPGLRGRRPRGQPSGCDRERNVRAPVPAGRTADRAERTPGIRCRHALRDRRRGRRYRLHDAARGHAGNDVCGHGAAQAV